MKKTLFFVPFLVGSFAMAQQPAQMPLPAPLPPDQPQQIPQPLPAPAPVQGPGIPGPAPRPKKVPYEVLEGTDDLGSFFYWMERELNLQRGRGHSISAAVLATCPGAAADKFTAFRKMLRSLQTFGPTAYSETTTTVFDRAGRPGFVRVQRDVTAEGLMTRIAAVLTCKQENRTSDHMAKMLKAAFDEAVTVKVEHPDTKEKLQWAEDLYTLLMVATLLR